MRIESIILFILISTSTCLAFDLSPLNLQPGDKITLTGTAAPGELVNIRSSFAMDLPISEGQYEYETSVEIPQKPNRFAVTARNVKDLNVGVKMVIWITKRFESSGGAASISQSDVPPGRYDLKMFGTATDGASKVPVEVNAETSVKADSAGKYSLIIDTSGIPNGDYKIMGAGDSKIVRIGGSSGALGSEGSGSEGSSSGVGHESYDDSGSAPMPPAKENSQGKEITPDILAWYAIQNHLDPNDSRQYSDAQRQLKNMLSGGYWKVIARGEPLTEKAGNCEDKYCLVRGIGACTTCRAEEMLTQFNKQAVEASGAEKNATASKNMDASENKSLPSGQASSTEETKGFLDSIIDEIKRIIGG